MSAFRDAYQQLTPQHMLLNTHGPGEVSFELYYIKDPAYLRAKVRVTLDAQPTQVHGAEFEWWQLVADADKVALFVSPFGFSDDWDVVPAVQ